MTFSEFFWIVFPYLATWMAIGGIATLVSVFRRWCNGKMIRVWDLERTLLSMLAGPIALIAYYAMWRDNGNKMVMRGKGGGTSKW
jgi:hypothetical protein